MKRKSINKNRIFDFFSSPFVLALPIAITIIYFLPDIFQKYMVEQTYSGKSNRVNSVEEYHDLDYDGYSERVVSFKNLVGLPSIKILENDGSIVDQWNFSGKYPNRGNTFACADLNADSLMEVYVFTFSNDTLYFHAFDPISKGKFIFQNKPISTIGKYKGRTDIRLGGVKVIDIDGDGFSELLIKIHAGFSKQPRGLFAYNHHLDTIIRTPILGAFFSHIICTDLNEDNLPEFFYGSSTLGNIPDSLGIPYSDYSSWLMGFNEKLDFMFTPYEYDVYPSRISIAKIKSGDKNRIVAFFKNKSKSSLSSMIALFNKKGEIIRKKLIKEDDIAYNMHQGISTIEYEGRPVIMTLINDNKVVLLDTLFMPVKTIKDVSYSSVIFNEDLNKDGRKELVLKDLNSNVIITDKFLEHPVILGTKLSSTFMKPCRISIKENGNKQSEIFINVNNTNTCYSYSSNSLYYLKYPIWLFVYLGIVLIIYFIMIIQRKQLQRKMAIENQINTLQLKTIKSQMDPHFMFNVLNSISTNILNDKKETAYSYMIKFSSLLRELFTNADKLVITLKEELAFVENYLQLEKFRFKDKLSFEFEIDPKVDQTTSIPRMLIQLFVENAIKHGLRHKEGKGNILIKVEQKNKQLSISIEDDGIGRKAAKQFTEGHGKGLKIIDEMVGLYKKTKGLQISYRYDDLANENGQAIGTRSVVSVPVKV